MVGSELKLSHIEKKWHQTGVIQRIGFNEELCLELQTTKDLPKDTTSGFMVELIWKSTSYKRMKHGLQQFWKNQQSISSYLYYKLLGQEKEVPILETMIPQNVKAPNLPELNIYQIEAVKKALTQPLCLIQGPPGTGKTVTSAAIIYHLVESIKRNKSNSKILVCAPSNIVTDQLAEKIHATGVKVLRLCSKSRETVVSSIDFLSLHHQIRSSKLMKHQKLQQYFQKLNDYIQLTPKEEIEFKKLREIAENDLINSASVICTTCITSFDTRLKNYKFKHVLIDEATQAIEPEALLPMLKGSNQVILVGDHRQLGPVITCRITARAGLNRSMFERLVSLGIRPIRLQVQYRMHPELTNFPSNTFYEGTLQNGVTFSDRQFKGEFPWPNSQKPMMFLDVAGAEETSASGTSFLNRKEATQIERIVYFLVKAGVKPNKLGIITPYKGQRAYIISDLQKNGQLNPSLYKEIEIASVDGFQGREKDFILISCVRANEGVGIGFLNDPRRLNVTLTRARYGMIIVGNAKVLAKQVIWNNLLIHFKENDLLVEGNMPNLRKSNAVFAEKQVYNAERKNEDEDDNKSIVSDYSQSSNWKYDVVQQFDKPITSGYRESQYGFNQIPQMQAFQKQKQTKPKVQEITDDLDIFYFGQN